MALLKSPAVQAVAFFFPASGSGKCHVVRVGEDVAGCNGRTPMDVVQWGRVHVMRHDVAVHPILCKRCLNRFALKPSTGLRS